MKTKTRKEKQKIKKLARRLADYVTVGACSIQPRNLDLDTVMELGTFNEDGETVDFGNAFTVRGYIDDFNVVFFTDLYR